MHVFYRPEQTAAIRNSAGSPSAGKPALAVADWLRRGLVSPEQVHSFEPVGVDDLKRVHDADFVDGVLSLELDNGFGNRNADVARSLPYTSGSMLAAAEFATLRLRLLKVAGRVIETASRVRLAFAAACPHAVLFRGLARSFHPAGP